MAIAGYLRNFAFLRRRPVRENEIVAFFHRKPERIAANQGAREREVLRLFELKTRNEQLKFRELVKGKWLCSFKKYKGTVANQGAREGEMLCFFIENQKEAVANQGAREEHMVVFLHRTRKEQLQIREPEKRKWLCFFIEL